MRADDLFASPNPLARHYSRFRVDERILLTGHSHQAWPDAARLGQMAAWEDAAALADGKWDQAFTQAERVRAGYARLMDDPDGLYTLGESTHSLLVRLLSAFPLRQRPRIVTTDGEFHSARRQLGRLEEAGVEVVRIAAQPAATVGDRLAAVVDDRTAAVLTSTIFFRSAHIAGSLPAAAEACRRFGAALVLDVYHQLNVVPFSVRELGLEDVFAVGGGYKYCQLGEGNAFLRFPADCELRPLVTGWFAEFEALSGPEGEPVAYSEGPWRFAGATYDPTSNYRAAAVFDFFHEMELDPERLRSLSQNQVGLLARGFDALDLPAEVIDRDRTVELPGVGGFLALRSPHAGALCRHLAAAGVTTDFRDDVLRLGPAPYLSRRQLEDAVEALGAVVGSLAPVG